LGKGRPPRREERDIRRKEEMRVTEGETDGGAFRLMMRHMEKAVA
jgi:hypothetical protein